MCILPLGRITDCFEKIAMKMTKTYLFNLYICLTFRLYILPGVIHRVNNHDLSTPLDQLKIYFIYSNIYSEQILLVCFINDAFVARGRYSTLWPEKSQRGYSRPEAATAHCGQRSQHLRSYRGYLQPESATVCYGKDIYIFCYGVMPIIIMPSFLSFF